MCQTNREMAGNLKSSHSLTITPIAEKVVVAKINSFRQKMHRTISEHELGSTWMP